MSLAVVYNYLNVVVDICVEVNTFTRIKLTTGRVTIQFDTLDVPADPNILVFLNQDGNLAAIEGTDLGATGLLVTKGWFVRMDAELDGVTWLRSAVETFAEDLIRSRKPDA